MRIKEEQAKFFKDAVFDVSRTAEVYLFGSRADDTKHGGDIDICIIDYREFSWDEKNKIRLSFWAKFGEQKLDILSYAKDDDSTFKHVIMESKIMKLN